MNLKFEVGGNFLNNNYSRNPFPIILQEGLTRLWVFALVDPTLLN